MKQTKLHGLLILTCLVSVVGLAQQPRRMQLDDLGRIVRDRIRKLRPIANPSSSSSHAQTTTTIGTTRTWF